MSTRKRYRFAVVKVFLQDLLCFKFMIVGEDRFIAEIHCVRNLILVGITDFLIDHFISMIFIVLNLKEHVLARGVKKLSIIVLKES